jgi:hypothetical protein
LNDVRGILPPDMLGGVKDSVGYFGTAWVRVVFAIRAIIVALAACSSLNIWLRGWPTGLPSMDSLWHACMNRHAGMALSPRSHRCRTRVNFVHNPPNHLSRNGTIGEEYICIHIHSNYARKETLQYLGCVDFTLARIYFFACVEPFTIIGDSKEPHHPSPL